MFKNLWKTFGFVLALSLGLGLSAQVTECPKDDLFKWFICEMQNTPESRFTKETGYKVYFVYDFSRDQKHEIGSVLESLSKVESIKNRAITKLIFTSVKGGPFWSRPLHGSFDTSEFEDSYLEFFCPRGNSPSADQIQKALARLPSRDKYREWQNKIIRLQAGLGYKFQLGNVKDASSIDELLEFLLQKKQEGLLPVENGSKVIYLDSDFHFNNEFTRSIDVTAKKEEILYFLVRQIIYRPRDSAISCADACGSSQCIWSKDSLYTSRCFYKKGGSFLKETTMSVGSTACEDVSDPHPQFGPSVPRDCQSCENWLLREWGNCVCAER